MRISYFTPGPLSHQMLKIKMMTDLYQAQFLYRKALSKLLRTIRLEFRTEKATINVFKIWNENVLVDCTTSVRFTLISIRVTQPPIFTKTFLPSETYTIIVSQKHVLYYDAFADKVRLRKRCNVICAPFKSLIFQPAEQQNELGILT